MWAFQRLCVLEMVIVTKWLAVSRDGEWTTVIRWFDCLCRLARRATATAIIGGSAWIRAIYIVP